MISSNTPSAASRRAGSSPGEASRARAEGEPVFLRETGERVGLLESPDQPVVRQQHLVEHVLAVDRDATAFDVMKAQQQTHQGRLACTGSTHDTDTLAGSDFQAQIVDHGAPAARQRAVAEAHVVEANDAAANLEFARIGPIRQRMRHRDRLHAFLHHTDVLEDAADLPRHPARHVGDLPRQRQRGRDRRRARLTGQPEPHAECGRADDQGGIHAGEGGHEAGGHTHVGGDALAVLDHRLTNVRVLVRRARKQLHRRKVGVRINHPSHDQRTRLRAQPRQVAHARHEVAQEEHKSDDPQDDRHCESPVRCADQKERGDPVHDDVPDGANT